MFPTYGILEKATQTTDEPNSEFNPKAKNEDMTAQYYHEKKIMFEHIAEKEAGLGINIILKEDVTKW